MFTLSVYVLFEMNFLFRTEDALCVNALKCARMIASQECLLTKLSYYSLRLYELWRREFTKLP